MTRGLGRRTLLATPALCALSFAATTARPGDGDDKSVAQSLDETRLTMDKWIETQQIISKEQKEWQQGKEILQGRVELVKNEVASLTEKIAQAQTAVAEANKKRQELDAENERLKAVGARLTEVVTAMEADVRRLFKSLPEPVQTRIQKVYQRIPEDPAKTTVSVAERFQNVLGILNEINSANSEITVNYEVHALADGRSSEVQAIYVGLAQAWFVSGSGEAGIGRPSADGWKWEDAKTIAGDVLMALEIQQGKQSPAFVPLPVKLK
jgi:septal ring factor EnvC (AmiA/AmiB activator)